VQSVKSEFARHGVSIIVISFAESERLAPYQEHHRWPFVLLADPKRTAYQAFALKRLSWFRVFAPSTLRFYFRLLREGQKLQSYGKDDYYQGGGDFLVDREGNILFAHRSEDPADRPEVGELLEAIDRTIISAGDKK
jgi:hypothetical protein